MRYEDILDYRVEVEDSLLDCAILKLTLQPLVENALYHGIKSKRNGGTIIVRVARVNEGLLLLDVEDNGVGLTPFKLSKIQAMLAENAGEPILNETGFGLDNVNKRIKLYYGEQYGLSIQSHYRSGTQVTVAIPKQPGLKEQNELEQMV